MTTKQKERKSAQEHIHDLHKKHYGKKKAAKDIPVTIEGEYAVAVQEYAKTTDAFPTGPVLAKITRDLKKELPKGAVIEDIILKDTDSGNISHAVAYFSVKITAPGDRLLAIIGPNKLIVPNNVEAMKTQKKKPADVAPGATKTTGVDTSSHPEKDGNGKITRKDLMLQAQAKGIKYFRILHRSELQRVLALHKEGHRAHDIFQIQEVAQKRWKAGWSSLKNKQEIAAPEKTKGKKKEVAAKKK